MEKPKKRAKNGQFLPGNREGTGRKKIPADVKEALAALTPDGVKRLGDIIRDGKDCDALEGIRMLFERLYGKPVQATDVQMDVTGGLDVRAQIHAALLEQAKQKREKADG